MSRSTTCTAVFAFLCLAVAHGRAEVGSVIVTYDGVATDDVRAAIEAGGGEVTRVYENVPVLAARLGGPLRLPGVVVEKNGTHPLVTPALSLAAPAGHLEPLASPQGYGAYLVSGAGATWPDTRMGAGTVVAVVDTGVYPNACLAHAVIGAPGFPDGFNATGDGLPATALGNHWHGTHVSGAIASDCGMCLPSWDGFRYAVEAAGLPTYDVCGDPDMRYIPFLGQAPAASIYPVKVFVADGGETTDDVVLAGLDHVLTLKRLGLLDVAIVNLSLGGWTLWDGFTAADRFYKAFDRADILVVAAAGNDGPRPNSVGSPATARSTVSVAAADFAATSRVLYEYVGIVDGADQIPDSGDERTGMGRVQRPGDETRIAGFSSRGPTADGRSGPDIAALGAWTAYAVGEGDILWAMGTSMATPVVAGAAALLRTWGADRGATPSAAALREALLAGANQAALGPAWRDVRATGAGLLDVPAALATLASGEASGYGDVIHVGRLTANILGRPAPGVAHWESGDVTLAPGESMAMVVQVADTTRQIAIRLSDIVVPPNADHAYFPNTLVVQVMGAERGSVPATFSFEYRTDQYGPEAWLFVEDGLWTVHLPGLGAFEVGRQPLQPGLYKFALAAGDANESPVSFRAMAERLDDAAAEPTGDVLADNVSVRPGDFLVYPADVPPGTAEARFDLSWSRQWDRLPTTDLDLVLVSPDGSQVFGEGATLAAPERTVLVDPMPGPWTALVIGYGVPLPTRATLRVTLE